MYDPAIHDEISYGLFFFNKKSVNCGTIMFCNKKVQPPHYLVFKSLVQNYSVITKYVDLIRKETHSF